MLKSVLAIISSTLLPSYGFTPLNENELVFVNVDHAPVAAVSTFTYGSKSDVCGLGMSSAQFPYRSGGGGVVIGVKDQHGLKVMPFVLNSQKVSSSASFFQDSEIQRSLSPCTDEWNVQSGNLSWIHYSPSWKMTNLETATIEEKKRFFLPATWITFTIKNTEPSTKEFYFGLPVSANSYSFSNGAYEGFISGEAAVATRSGQCDLLTGSDLSQNLNGMNTGFAFRSTLAAGETRTLTFAIAYFRNGAVDTRLNAPYTYTTLFKSFDDVIDYSMKLLPDARLRCEQLKAVLNGAGLNPYRKFLASHSMHSYRASTVSVTDSAGKTYWRELEGDYQYINTLDLTVDHAFYNSAMHPWVIRNVLDTFSGATNGGNGYHYDHPLYHPDTKAEVSPTGFSFHHDMGQGLTTALPEKDPTGYENAFSYMSLEQLHNFILCAGIYWKHSDDHAWLSENYELLKKCLTSLLLRDDVVAANRDGIPSYINFLDHKKEITTYDSLDASLRQVEQSGRNTIRGWACYVALQAMFNQLGDSSNATECSNMASLCASTISAKWNSYSSSLGYIPTFLNGSNTAATIPMIEGLIFPKEMGLANEISLSGPYAIMLQNLQSHITNILVTGRCIDSTTGAWKLTTGSEKTWQSKVYLCQAIAKDVLGISGPTVEGAVDQVHATFQLQQAPTQGWSDQLNSANTGLATQSLHYPRGITSSLWWINLQNNPNFPSPTLPPMAPTTVTAQGDSGKMIMTWEPSTMTDSVSIQRAASPNGPYITLAAGVTGASFVDYTIVESGTYYYTVTGTNVNGQGSSSTPVSAFVSVGSLSPPWIGQDIGNVGLSGSHNFSEEGNALGIQAAGTGIDGTEDSFHFISESASGDCSLRARIVSLGNVDPQSALGLMIRESKDAGSAQVSLQVSADHQISFRWRTSTGDITHSIPYSGNPLTFPCYLMINRSGNIFSGYQSADGKNWNLIGSTTSALSQACYIGVAASSHLSSSRNLAVVDQISSSILPATWNSQDIGSPALAGSAYYSPNGKFETMGAGSDISGSNDSFRYTSREVNGDCTIITRVETMTHTDVWAKSGLMIRSSTAANAANVAIVVTPQRGISFQWRTTNGGATGYTPNPWVGGITAPHYLKLVRSGNVFTAFNSIDGIHWTTVSSATVTMPTNVLVGLAVTSHNVGSLCTAVFNHVIVTTTTMSWRETYFSPADLADPSKEETVWGDMADPDGDGVTNLLEFALGGNPHDGTSPKLPLPSKVSDRLYMTYARANVAMKELTYTLQSSPNLNGFWSSADVTEEILSQDSLFQYIRTSVPATGDRKFLRLRVTR